MTESVSVLFVCLGNMRNICRSPMAEAVFKHTVKEQQLENKFSTIDSAGTAGYHTGEKPDQRSINCCREHGVPVNHRARKVVAEDFSIFDYILCMDKSNLKNLKNMAPTNSKAIVKLFGEYDPLGEHIINDPYYGGDDGFEHNFKQILRASEGFLKDIDFI